MVSQDKSAYQFSVATNEYIGQGKEKAEYQSIVKPGSTEPGRLMAR